MTDRSAADMSLLSHIASVQQLADGAPRFRVPALFDQPIWDQLAALEAEGGVAAEVRAFLDGQLETGDLLLDLAPDAGFVALSAATAPGGVATVVLGNIDTAHFDALQDAAADAGGWIERLPSVSAEAIAALVTARLEPNGRWFVHAAADQVLEVCTVLADSNSSAQLFALCISEGANVPDWTTTTAVLAGLGLLPCTLGERDGDVLLLPVTAWPAGGLIAVPAALMDQIREVPDPTYAEPVRPLGAARPVPAPWRGVCDGLSLIAPHSRTGYGITGAQLLRALQAKGVPVAFFPIGPVDASLAPNPALPRAMDAQAFFNADAPSVRLAQQFDLALHAGRGPRIAFPIFETTEFSPRDLHHLRSQDALLVCTPWARAVCVANGLTDVPIHVVPLGVDLEVFHPGVTPVTKTPDTVFLHVGKLEARKGQRELLRAFEAAFAPSDSVRLVLACHNPFVGREALEAALAPFRVSPMAHRIIVHAAALPTAHDVAALMASADCGVFPARAEGWNLELIEMMAMGKAIIASEATAHTAYLTAQNAHRLVMGPPESAAEGGLLGVWSSWGDAQHEQLVHALRAVHQARRENTLGVNHAGLATARAHTWDATAEALLRAVEANA